MKLSWKIFRNTIILVLIALSLGGTIMISMTLQESLSYEISQAKEEIISMHRDIAILLANDSRTLYMTEESVLEVIIGTIEENWKEEGKQFRLRYKDGKTISKSTIEDFSQNQETKTEDKKLIYTIYPVRDKYYLEMSLEIKLQTETLVIDNYKDITSIFTLRKKQQHYFIVIITGVGLFCALLNYINVLWISKAITGLTKMAARMQQGDLSVRVENKADDEIGILSESFNSMADRLEENIQELKEAVKRQEDFVGSFAHEIRTPLTSMIGYADLLRRKQLEEEAFTAATNYIYNEGKRLELLSSKLMDLLVVKVSIPDFEIIPIRKLIDESIHVLDNLLKVKNITVILEIEDFNVRVDMVLMKTVLINLLDNARKAVSQNGSINLIAREEEKGKAFVIIKDNGMGIPKEEISKIQQAFYRVDKSRSRKEGGAGLGLAISANIMEIHGGEILIDSEIGKGTSITLTWEGIKNET